jgi:CRISP-associated protein Cas1
VRLRDINQVNLFGNIQVSTQAMQTLLFAQIPVVLFTEHGYFYGMLQGTGLKNILLRREQFRLADDPARTLAIAKVPGGGQDPQPARLADAQSHQSAAGAIAELKRLVGKAEAAPSAETLLGIEGNAAASTSSISPG